MWRAIKMDHVQRTLPWHLLLRPLTSAFTLRIMDGLDPHTSKPRNLRNYCQSAKKIPQTLRDFCLRLPAPDLKMYMDLKYAYLLARYCWCVEFKRYCSEYFIDLNGLVMLLVTDEPCEIQLIYIHLLLSTSLSSIINQRYWLRFSLRNFALNNTMNLAQVS